MAKESGIAKSIGDQKEDDMEGGGDHRLCDYLRTGAKVSKDEANYREQQSYKDKQGNSEQSCDICKFNLPAERICHIVDGKVNNEHGISRYYAPKGEGMLLGDIVWDFEKKTGKKLDYSMGYVINETMDGFNCKDCEYYMFSHLYLLLKGTLEPKMSCAFIIKNGNGVEV